MITEQCSSFHAFSDQLEKPSYLFFSLRHLATWQFKVAVICSSFFFFNLCVQNVFIRLLSLEFQITVLHV